MIFREEFVS